MSPENPHATAARLLDAAIASLRDDILPLLGDDVARMRVDHVTRLLRNAAARLTHRDAKLQRLLRAAAGAGFAGDTDASGEQQRRGVEAAISAAWPALLEAVAAGDDGALAKLRALVALEKDFYVALDPDIARGSVVVYRGGRIDEEVAAAPASRWPVLDAAGLSAYLQAREGRASVRAEGLRLIPGGFSKETVFFTLVDEADGSHRDLVIRKDMPYPFIERTIVNEFDVLKALHARGFPVARPLWLETDFDRFGGCFLVSERVSGTSNAASWSSDPARARAACRELARVLAQLHAYEPAELGYPKSDAAQSAGALIAAEIGRWTALFHRRRGEAVPLQELPLLWLARNVPAALFDRPARVMHGDFGFHNLMFDEHGKVTALLDWEFSGLGDPTQDLCFVRLFVEPLMPWADFLKLYREAGGSAPCAEAEFFFDLWIKTRNSIGCVAAQQLFDTELPRETKFALAGHVFGPYLHIDECESLLDHLQATRS